MFLEGSPGERVSQELTIKNQTRLDVVLHPELFDMQEGRGNSTALDFVAPGEARRGAADWVQPLDEIELGAISQGTYRVVVDIPEDAGPGGYYAAIVFSIPDPREDAQIPIEQTASVPIFITVDGAYERDLRVSAEAKDRWKWRGGVATWVVEVENMGDVHEVVAGRLRVDGLLGNTTSKPIEDGIMLPGERRTQRISFDLRDAPDLVGARLRVERDEGEPRHDDAERVVVLPWWLLLLVAIGAGVVAWRLRTRSGSRAEGWEYDEGDGSWDPSPPAG